MQQPMYANEEYGKDYRLYRDVKYNAPIVEQTMPRIEQPVFHTADFKEIPSVQSNTSKVGLTHIDPTSFWEQVQEQLDDLFANYPEEKTLSKLMPDTKWVKVDYDNNGRYYVVGVIGKDKPQFVVYGVPSRYSLQPPKELDGYCQWIPIDDNPRGTGYWLMYQDAITGESVKSI
jgi:hypothetical protein